jgi:hypothetical protein
VGEEGGRARGGGGFEIAVELEELGEEGEDEGEGDLWTLATSAATARRWVVYEVH